MLKKGRKVVTITKASPVILILILGLTAPVLASVSWSAVNNVSPDGIGNNCPSIAQVRNNDVWAVWQKQGGGSKTFDLWSIVYNSSNCTWSLPPRVMKISTPDQDNYPCIMQTSDGTIWVLWTINATSYHNSDIVYKTSTDYGTTWSSFNNITNDYGQTTGKNDVFPSALQASNGTVWVVWQKDINSTTIQIYYQTAPAGGSPWSPPMQLTKSSRFNVHPSIVQAQNGSIIVFYSANVYGAGTPQEIMYQVYNGRSWNPEQKLTNDGSSGLDDDFPSAVLTRTGAILVVWEQTDDNDNNNILYRSSKDNGKTWSTTTSLTTDGVSTSPSVTQGNDKRIWIAYVHADETNGLLYIYCTTSDPLIIKADLKSISSAFGSTRGGPRWDYGSDLDKNGIVNAKDLYVLSRYYNNSL